MKILALLLLLGLATGASDDADDVYVGTLLSVSHTSMEMRLGESELAVGFVGDAAALADLDTLKVGDEVRVVFGSTTPPGESRSINKLLSIRRCAEVDAQCDADRKAQAANAAEDDAARSMAEAKQARCEREMDKTLLNDPRYVPLTVEIPGAQADEYLRQLYALTGKRKTCATAVVKDHVRAVFEACELHHCGDRVGGGCSHIVGYALTDDVIVRALTTCKED